jgi:hypothetical protein
VPLGAGRRKDWTPVSSEKRVVVAGGHMLDAPDRSEPRFPVSEVPRVTAEVRAALERWGSGPKTTLITAGASGADLIAAEQALALGAAIHLVLPLPPQEFEDRSVAAPGSDWVRRFRRVLKIAETEVIGESTGKAIFSQANDRIVELARSRDSRPNAIVVWNGQRGDGPGGTQNLVDQLGFEAPNEHIVVIDPTPRIYERRQEGTSPNKLLALDGGGIRGVLSIEILAALEGRLRERYGSALVLSDYFDYIGGTSTGAIIAAALAFGKSVSEIRNKYGTLVVLR